jgi:hypothetical protein
VQRPALPPQHHPSITCNRPTENSNFPPFPHPPTFPSFRFSPPPSAPHSRSALPIPMAAAAGGGDGEARAMLQRHQPFAPSPGEYHHFAAPGADDMVEAVVFRTPVSSRWSCWNFPVAVGLLHAVGKGAGGLRARRRWARLARALPWIW